MASAIGDGLLGFIAGTAGGLAAGEQQKFQSQLELDRQLSLLQAQRAFAEEDRQNTIQSLGGAFPELDEDKLTALATPEGRAVGEFVSKQEQARRDQEEAEQSDAAIQRFLDTGEITSARQVRALRDANINIDNALFPEEDEETKPLTQEQAEEIGPVLGLTPSQTRAFSESGLLNSNSASTLLNASRRSGPNGRVNLVPVVNKEDGTVLQLPPDQALNMTAINENGEQLWETGKIETSRDESFIVTPSQRVRIPNRGEEDLNQLTRIKSSNRRDPLLSRLNMEFANPASLTARDEVEKAQGLIDTFVSNVGRFPVIGDALQAVTGGPVEQKSIAGRSTLENLVTQTKQFFDLPGRSLTVEIENLLSQISSPDGLSGLFTRDPETFTKLSVLRRNVAAEVSRARERDPEGESVLLGEGVLESLDTIFANRMLSNTVVPMEEGNPIPITELNTPEDFEKINMEALRNDPRSLAAVRLWAQRIELLQGN